MDYLDLMDFELEYGEYPMPNNFKDIEKENE